MEDEIVSITKQELNELLDRSLYLDALKESLEDNVDCTNKIYELANVLHNKWKEPWE